MDNEEYIRVGTCYLKLCRVPTATGEFREKYLPWNIETIRQDHSKDFVANIGKHGQTDPVRTVQIDPFKTA